MSMQSYVFIGFCFIIGLVSLFSVAVILRGVFREVCGIGSKIFGWVKDFLTFKSRSKIQSKVVVTKPQLVKPGFEPASVGLERNLESSRRKVLVFRLFYLETTKKMVSISISFGVEVVEEESRSDFRFKIGFMNFVFSIDMKKKSKYRAKSRKTKTEQRKTEISQVSIISDEVAKIDNSIEGISEEAMDSVEVLTLSSVPDSLSRSSDLDVIDSEEKNSSDNASINCKGRFKDRWEQIKSTPG